MLRGRTEINYELKLKIHMQALSVSGFILWLSDISFCKGYCDICLYKNMQ